MMKLTFTIHITRDLLELTTVAALVINLIFFGFLMDLLRHI